MRGKLKISKYALLMDARLAKLIEEKFKQNKVVLYYNNVNKTITIKQEKKVKEIVNYDVYNDYIAKSVDYIKDDQIIGSEISHMRRLENTKIPVENKAGNIRVNYYQEDLYPKSYTTNNNYGSVAGVQYEIKSPGTNATNFTNPSELFEGFQEVINKNIIGSKSSNEYNIGEMIEGSYEVKQLPSRAQISNAYLSGQIKSNLSVSDGTTFVLKDVSDDALTLSLQTNQQTPKIVLDYVIEEIDGRKYLLVEKYNIKTELKESDIPTVVLLEEIKFLIKHYGLINDEGLSGEIKELRDKLNEDFGPL